MAEISRQNNFDLIRLCAALQVAIIHGIYHLEVDSTGYGMIQSILNYFPGVSIFFIISGFLVTQSALRLRENVCYYIANRFLRIYPALWGGLLISIIMVIFSAPKIIFGDLVHFTIWLFAQLTFVQFYNPDFLRSYGVGVINGSLWTIIVDPEIWTVC